MNRVLTLLLVCGLCGADAISWSSCDEGSSTLKDVSISPDPPVAGKALDVIVNAVVGEKDVNGGSIGVSVKAWGITVYSTTLDVCKSVDGGCPVAAGSAAVITYSQSVPGIAPSGTYTVHLDGDLFCANASVKLGKQGSLGERTRETLRALRDVVLARAR